MSKPLPSDTYGSSPGEKQMRALGFSHFLLWPGIQLAYHPDTGVGTEDSALGDSLLRVLAVKPFLLHVLHFFSLSLPPSWHPGFLSQAAASDVVLLVGLIYCFHCVTPLLSLFAVPFWVRLPKARQADTVLLGRPNPFHHYWRRGLSTQPAIHCILQRPLCPK